jgi:hypothetical protein
MKKWLLPVLALVLTASVAGAQYSSDFESLNASATGVVLTGQDGFYLPAGSVDFLAYTYTGNALGVPQNPQGGNQFVGGTGPGDGTTYARAQRDVSFGLGFGVWTISYDFCAGYLGTPPSSNNLGSFSIRYDDANVHEIHLFSWVDPNTATNYNAWYMKYDAAGTQDAHHRPGDHADHGVQPDGLVPRGRRGRCGRSSGELPLLRRRRLDSGELHRLGQHEHRGGLHSHGRLLPQRRLLRGHHPG